MSEQNDIEIRRFVCFIILPMAMDGDYSFSFSCFPIYRC